jgi:hypothetical protein
MCSGTAKGWVRPPSFQTGHGRTGSAVVLAIFCWLGAIFSR